MSRIGFYVSNVLSSASLAQSIGFDPNLPATNITTRRPGESGSAMASNPGLGLAGSTFMINLSGGVGDNTHLDVQITSGATAGTYDVTLSPGTYTAHALAAHIETRLIAVTALASFSCIYLPADGFFRIIATETFTILGATGANVAAGAVNEIGYPAADLASTGGGSGLLNLTTGSARFGTMVWARWEIADADRGVALAVLQSDPATGAPAADFAKASVYLANSYKGPTTSHWDAAVTAGTAEKIALSPPGSEHASNPIHMGSRTTGTARTHVFFVWRFFDNAREHHVGFVGLMKVLSSATRQVLPIRSMQRESGSGVLARDYYPAKRRQRIGIEVEVSDWKWAADYSAVLYPLEIIGTSGVFGVAVNSSAIIAGTVDAEDEADRELLFLGGLGELPRRGLTGIDDDRAGASLTLLQVV